ncbi:MAG TPA: ChaN family lipoprotein, partial [Burkholderiaceae bacterium]
MALLGEVHDNAVLHERRLRILRRAVDAGWRPALAMEQFDADRQADLERARRERPHDPDHLIDAAASTRTGWDWERYRPLIALALAHDLPLVGANLPDALARRLVREDAGAVLGAARARELRLEGPGAIEPDAAWREAQRAEIDAGHCHALPASLLPGMARAQFVRDAVMAEAVERAAARGGVALVAGNGHVRRDLGVPRWL